ncbi:MAG: hypothetical protein LAO79_06800 [Acidobacteriia bacterium]|nr:hypothetical protein [Terriglobia bacterium]
MTAGAQSEFLNHNRPLLDSHNCYPYEGKWTDRIDRALSTGFPVAIEQDIAWADGHPVVSHTSKTKGGEPSLRDHFFERVRPIVEKALKENRRETWPIVVLHFDFKTLDAQTIRAVWDILGEYESWITTAPQTADPHTLAPFDPKPLLVLTEDADEQEQIFFHDLKPGQRLRIFGSAHTAKIEAKTREERAHIAATMPAEKLLAEPPTNYRRWWNNSWAEVEEGGQTKAGDWTADDDRRLRALVDRAHSLGYWIRFYTLDGFTEQENRGWDQGYNFGSREAAEKRWQAAYHAGVNLIATDQYEDLAAFLKKLR